MPTALRLALSMLAILVATAPAAHAQVSQEEHEKHHPQSAGPGNESGMMDGGRFRRLLHAQSRPQSLSGSR